MRIGEHMCIIPFHASSRDREEREEAGAEINGAKRAPKASRTRSKKRSLKQDADAGGAPAGRWRRAHSKLSRNSESGRKNSNGDDSERITFSRFVEIFKEAYITTMSSFANKPGGLGGMTMGGKIDLPDATPSRTFKEPRDFVRSWSKRRPDYISSPAPEYFAKGPERDFAQRIQASH